MSVLLDTNVLSEMVKPSPDPSMQRWMASQSQHGLFVSAVTQAEMLLGMCLLPLGRRREALREALESTFDQDFAARILPFDSGAAPLYAEIVAGRRSAGRPISPADAQIAAIARRHRLAVATRNVDDFAGCGVAVTNPWNPVA